MNPNWINFKELRSRLSLTQVLDFYGIKHLAMKGSQLVGFCPIPSHEGNRRTPSFSAHPEKGIFQCFGCGAKGNLLDLAVLLEGGNPRRGLDVRKAALKLNKLTGGGSIDASQNPVPERPVSTSPKHIINEPLNFWLKDLDPSHSYLIERGFEREVLQKFGVGFCSKGLFAGRITIPLHNTEGQLIGYAGRLVDDERISAENPKYLFPSKRERDGDILEFKKSLFVYNGHAIGEALDELIVVEGFPSVWWLTQLGFPSSVAIMGSTGSEEQISVIVSKTKPNGRVWILGDGDNAGIRCGNELCAAVANQRFCRLIVRIGKQPTDYSRQELHRILMEEAQA